MTPDTVHRVAVCIIGAGPAGSAASLTLSRRGISHLVIEADQFPRNKPCGDILTSGAVRALGRLEPSVLEELETKGLLNPIWHTSTYGPGGNKISIAFRPLEKGTQKPGCYAVNRWDLDEAMYRRISARPEAEIWTGIRAQKISYTPEGIQLETQCGRRVEARCLLMATGSSNGLLKELGLRQEKQDAAVGIRQHFEGIDTQPDHTELFLLEGKMPGGLYITPLGNGLFNVNLVLSLQKVNQEKINLRESLEQAIRQIPVLQKKFAHARAVGSPEGSQLFLGLRRRPAAGNRFLIAGDAAGLIEFFSGNGIPQAYISGEMAALRIAEALEKNDFSPSFLGGYQQELFSRLKPNPAFGRFVFRQLHRPGFQRRFLSFVDRVASSPGGQELVDTVLYARRPGLALLNPLLWYRILRKPSPIQEPENRPIPISGEQVQAGAEIG